MNMQVRGEKKEMLVQRNYTSLYITVKSPLNILRENYDGSQTQMFSVRDEDKQHSSQPKCLQQPAGVLPVF